MSDTQNSASVTGAAPVLTLSEDAPAAPSLTLDLEEPKPAPALSPLELTLELVKQQYPHENLDGEALDEVRSDIRQHLSRSKVLSSQSLANADEPGFVFSAWRSDRVGG